MKYAILVEADARIFLYRLNFLFTSEDLMKNQVKQCVRFRIQWSEWSSLLLNYLRRHNIQIHRFLNCTWDTYTHRLDLLPLRCRR